MKFNVAEIKKGWQNLNAERHSRGGIALTNGQIYAWKVTLSSLCL